jgi:hypothetical protein
MGRGMSSVTPISQAVLFARDPTGPYLPGGGVARVTTGTYAEPSDWSLVHQEMLRPVLYGVVGAASGAITACSSASSVVFVGDALPMPMPLLEGPSESAASLQRIERTFGTSASDLSKMLRVSRPMIYHYREGMAPDVENYRRIKLLASLADDVVTETTLSLGPVLKLPQPEGRTLLALLSEKEPDVPTLRRMLLRAGADLEKRRKVAASLAYATPHDRQDIMRARHASGKPVYVSDPDVPGRIMQIRPDQTRVRGRMVNRVFVPDEE